MQIKVKSRAIVILGLVFLAACSSNPTTTSSPTDNPPAASKPALSPSPAASPGKTATNTTSHGGQGGQVIESGPYHLELLTVNEANGTHIDFFLQKGDAHEPIPNAQVTAQVQLPDGTQKALNLKYDAAGKHYYSVLPGTATGEYKVAILSDIQGEKVNARYTFKR